MCGIAGFLSATPCRNSEAVLAVLKRMAHTLVTRGPDDLGLWSDEAGIGLAHRRLSILDLSPAGHQPMACSSGRYLIVFNGEIYNHLDLRAKLEKVDSSGLVATGWRGHSDTETLLAGFVAWGIRRTVELCIGMFAFAVWDRKERTLTLGRDRLGEKPIYYGWQGRGIEACFLFGSELKSIKAHPAFAAEIDRNALCLLMRHNYIPAPHSIYHGIYKLQPGSLLTVSLDRREPAREIYWSLPEIAVAGSQSSLADSPRAMVDELEALLRSSVRRQMIADVPFGAFLSGGVDSSTVVALMQAQSNRAVKTFTIGFNEKAYDEAVHAKAIARYLGTDHTEVYVTPQQALDIIPKLPSVYCEPFADSSQIPTFLVSQLARQQVTVCLSGDGGDELFAGYCRYVLANNLWGKISCLPRGVRSLSASAIQALSPKAWGSILAPFQPIKSTSSRTFNLGDKLYKFSELLSADSIDSLYLGLVSHWEPGGVVIGGREPATCLRGDSLSLAGLDALQRMMVLDSITYLPDDILVKVDRAAMGVSLEVRSPFLDHPLVEFAWRLPQSTKLHQGTGKWILRQVLHRHLPKELVERPKMGFGAPIDSWLRGPLNEWAETLLNEGRLKREGFFNSGLIRTKWSEHLSGRRNWQYHLWDVLMFQAWLEEQ